MTVKFSKMTEGVAEFIVNDARENLTAEPEAGEVIDAEFQIVPDPMDELKREHYEEILRLNRDVKLAQMRYDIAKGEAKAKKEELECLSLELSNLIADGPQKPDPQKELPFDAAESGDIRNWDLTPITEALKLTAKQREKLEEIGIKTVGQFEFLRAGRDPIYPDGLRSIKGFGAATVDAMENDIVEWLAANAREVEGDGGSDD